MRANYYEGDKSWEIEGSAEEVVKVADEFFDRDTLSKSYTKQLRDQKWEINYLERLFSNIKNSLLYVDRDALNKMIDYLLSENNKSSTNNEKALKAMAEVAKQILEMKEYNEK